MHLVDIDRKGKITILPVRPRGIAVPSGKKSGILPIIPAHRADHGRGPAPPFARPGIRVGFQMHAGGGIHPEFILLTFQGYRTADFRLPDSIRRHPPHIRTAPAVKVPHYLDPRGTVGKCPENVQIVPLCPGPMHAHIRICIRIGALVKIIIRQFILRSEHAKIPPFPYFSAGSPGLCTHCGNNSSNKGSQPIPRNLDKQMLL
ncbi:unknown [Clostridium sp. CAG:448]|nr:unknown [Clostridium sp. CAG:448]